ncbi:putative transcriptional regulator [Photobacterium aphoticum]|uniref:Putative transcriptional regulator n=1 Tax=Photobacterium aphoticum TaxID=754436 RepID=A0A090QKL7_9GAMM|nr:putative transcriptional regulator [Photobacterium aphoticum]
MHDKTLVPLIHTAHANAFITLIKHFEHDIYPLLKAAGLPSNILRQPYEFVSTTPIQHLLALMAEQADPYHYGMILRHEIKTFFIPKVLQRLHHVTTIEDALQQLTVTIKHESPSTQISIHRFNDMPCFADKNPKTIRQDFTGPRYFLFCLLLSLSAH